MRSDLLRTTSVVLAFLGGVSVALAQQGVQQDAQQPAAPAAAQQQSQQEKAQQTPSGKAGTNEPSAQAATVKPPADAVFVDGALAVPGAPADSRHGTGKILPAERGRRQAHHHGLHVQDADR